jgi:hypothetical protein
LTHSDPLLPAASTPVGIQAPAPLPNAPEATGAPSARTGRAPPPASKSGSKGLGAAGIGGCAAGALALVVALAVLAVLLVRRRQRAIESAAAHTLMRSAPVIDVASSAASDVPHGAGSWVSWSSCTGASSSPCCALCNAVHSVMYALRTETGVHAAKGRGQCVSHAAH